MKNIISLNNFIQKNQIHEIDKLMYNKDFLYKLSFSQLFTKNEQLYISYILHLNSNDILDENQISYLYNGNLNEGFITNTINKLGSFTHKIYKNTSNILNKIRLFLKKYYDEIIDNFDRSYNLVGKRNKEWHNILAKSIYRRYSKNIDNLIIEADNDELAWYEKSYYYLLNIYIKMLNEIKSLFKKEIITDIKESLLNDTFWIRLFESDEIIQQNMFDDYLNNYLKSVRQKIIKIDIFVNTQFQGVIKIADYILSASLLNAAKAIKISGGPDVPKGGFKTTSTAFLYVLQYRYVELTSKIYKYTNTKLFISSTAKYLFRKGVYKLIPGSSVIFKFAGIINNIDIFRKLIVIVDNNHKDQIKNHI